MLATNLLVVVAAVLLEMTMTMTMVTTTTTAKVFAKVQKNHASSIRVCHECGITFKKPIEYTRHLAGRVHREQLARTIPPEALWQEYLLTGWHTSSSNVTMADISPVFTLDELSTLQLKYRENNLHPSPTLSDLRDPRTKARVWRYIRDCMGQSHFPELALILAAAEQDDAGHIRVKELFESVEVYRCIVNFIVSAQRTLKASNQPPIESIVELAAGHGLVSVLLAYRFPKLKVVLYDLYKRPTFQAFLDAFESQGLKRPGEQMVLPNILFYEEDMANAAKHITPQSLVVCLHGCAGVNEFAVQMADDAASPWFVMPCCIKKDQYMGPDCHVLFSDDASRYPLLCGAFAQQFRAQLITTIDKRITNRNICIAGGLGASDTDPTMTSGAGEIEQGSELTSLSNAVKRRRLPKLLLS
jgi:hypothetical protein